LLHSYSRYSMPIHWLVHGHMTSNNETVTAECHEQATLRKLWCQMGNSLLLPAKCWLLLHMIRVRSWRWPDVVTGISAGFSKFAFALLYNKSLNDWSLGEQLLSDKCFTIKSWNSEQCGSEVFEKKGVNIFASGSLLASLNPRLASLRTLLSLQDTVVLCQSIRKERGQDIFCFHAVLQKESGRGLLWWVNQCFISFIDLYYVFLKR